MPFPRPQLAQLRQQSRQFLQTRLPGADLTLQNSVLSTFADLIAFLSYGEYGYLDWMAEQLFPDTADNDYLERWASIYGLARQSAAPSEGVVVFSGVAGTLIPQGTKVQANNAVIYTTQADGTVAGSGAISIAVIAATSGTAGNQLAGAPVTLTTPIGSIVGVAIFDGAGATGGANAEDDVSLRTRVLLRIQQPPQGGTASDYVQWALAANGVTRAWCFPLRRGLGTVDVSFVMDGRTNIFPLAADVQQVQDYVRARAPVTADVLVFAPTAYPLNVTINELSPNTVATHAAILASLADTLFSGGVPGATVYYSQLIEAVMSAQGVNFCGITFPPGDIIIPSGSLPILGAVSFPGIA